MSNRQAVFSVQSQCSLSLCGEWFLGKIHHETQRTLRTHREDQIEYDLRRSHTHEQVYFSLRIVTRYRNRS
jgi:hypothetical protein